MKLVRASETPTLKEFAYFIPDTQDDLNSVIDRVSKAYAKFEGTRIYIFEVNRKNLDLVNMSDIHVLRNLYSKTGANKVSVNNNYYSSDDEEDDTTNYDVALKKSFYINNGEIKRNSAPTRNNKVSEYVCDVLKKNGYIAGPLKKMYGEQKFHEEVMLCKKGQKKLKILSENRAPTVPLKPVDRKRKQINWSPPSTTIKFLNNSPPGTPPSKIKSLRLNNYYNIE